jgi:hypothetical protein
MINLYVGSPTNQYFRSKCVMTDCSMSLVVVGTNIFVTGPNIIFRWYNDDGVDGDYDDAPDADDSGESSSSTSSFHFGIMVLLLPLLWVVMDGR